MGYSKDLLKEIKNSKLRIIFSFAFYIIAISYISIKIFKTQSVMWFDWLYFSAMFLSGFTHMMAGLGHPLERLVGKAYINIDNHLILFKPGLYDAEQKVEWNNINSIDSKNGYLTITKIDKSTTKLMLSKLTFSDIQDIKEVIIKIAESKNISINVE